MTMLLFLYSISYSISCRNAAAAAKGPITRLASVSAQRIVNGVPNGAGPVTAALAAGAAAAKGPITRLASVSAQRIVNGVPNGAGPVTAALAAATPKMRTGTVNGST